MGIRMPILGPFDMGCDDDIGPEEEDKEEFVKVLLPGEGLLGLAVFGGVPLGPEGCMGGVEDEAGGVERE